MKKKGFILVLAGIFLVLAVISAYGYLRLGQLSKTAAEFDSMYDTLVSMGQTGMLAGNSALFNFFIRYRLVFLIASALVFVGGAIVCILPGRNKKEA